MSYKSILPVSCHTTALSAGICRSCVNHPLYSHVMSEAGQRLNELRAALLSQLISVHPSWKVTLTCTMVYYSCCLIILLPCGRSGSVDKDSLRGWTKNVIATSPAASSWTTLSANTVTCWQTSLARAITKMTPVLATGRQKIMSQAGQPKKLWHTFQSILGRDQSGKLPKSRSSAHKFLDFSSKKVEDVHCSTAGSTAQLMLPDADVSFDAFEHCTADDVKQIVTSAPSKSAPSIRCQLPSWRSFCQNFCHIWLTCVTRH